MRSRIQALFCATFSLLCVLANGASAQTELHFFEGDSASDSFGMNADAAGDVNGDGFADIIAGAPQYNCPLQGPGYVRVFSGLDGSVLHEWSGDAVGDGFGFAVSGAGDLNQDGYDDVFVGAPQSFCAPSTGYVRAFSGIDGSVLLNLHGLEVLDQVGYSVDGLPDLDGDLVNDLLIGAPGDNTQNGQTGSVSVISGATGARIAVHIASPGHNFGRLVAALGDLNGDGVDDYMASASAEIGASHVRVFSGADHSQLFVILSTEGSAQHIGGLGDMNLDGHDDFFVDKRIFSGFDASLIYHFPVNAGLLGVQYVGGGGDFDGDGAPDVLTGHGTFFGGGTNGYGHAWSVATGQVTFTVGHAVVTMTGAGDVNGDGVDDFIAGHTSPGPPHFDDPGWLRVLAGGAPAPVVRYCEAAPNSSVSFGSWMHFSGSTSFATNDLRLEATGTPDAFGIFFYGPEQTQTPLGEGSLCVGGAIKRLNPPVSTGGTLTTRLIDLTQPPFSEGAGALGPGDTRFFQLWYRDPLGGGTGFNFSDGLLVSFTP